MKNQKSINLVLAIMFSIFACPQSSFGQGLKWKLKPNDSFEVSLAQETSVTTEYNLIKRKIETTVNLEMDWLVTAVDADGIATIQQKIRDISMIMTTPDNTTLEIDSTKIKGSGAPRVEREMWSQVAPLLNATFDVEMKANGEIGSVTASEETLETLRQSNGSMKMRELLSPEGLNKLFGQSMVTLPDDDSDQWQIERAPQTNAGSFTSTQNLTLDGENELEGRTLTRISSVTATKQNANDDQENSNQLVNASGKGELYFDAEAGYFASSNFTNNFSFTQKYRDSAINTETSSTINMKIKKN